MKRNRVSLRISISNAMALIFLLLGGVCVEAARIGDHQLNEKTIEKQVTFYPTYGYRINGEWNIPIRIWVHEKPGFKRRGLAKAARRYLANRAGIDNLSKIEKKLFKERSEDFIADSESNEVIVLEFHNDSEHQKYPVKNGEGRFTTDRNGLIEGFLGLDEETANRLLKAQQSNHGWLQFQATSDDHWGVGFVRLIEPTGLSVISDIDDTIKITEIPAGESVVLKNTFFRSFIAAPCMAEMYRDFGDDVAFHYVSGGPWQMYRPLDGFLFTESAGFPRGSFHMKNLRTNPFEKETYKDIWTIIASGSQQATFDQKVSQIGTLMTHFPERRFILIGDSGEKDPEVFKKIREDFPSRIQEIRIRVVANNKANDPSRLDKMTQIPRNVEESKSCSEFVN